MNKQDFISGLRTALSGFPKAEIDERVNFYSEIIDDKIEEGMSECDAVYEIGDVNKIASQIIAEMPFSAIVKERVKPSKRLGAWEITLLALGSPIWLSLIISVFAVILSVYVSLWSVVASLWSVFASFAAVGICMLVFGFVLAASQSVPVGLAIIGASILCIGLSILTFFGCKYATDGIVRITRWVAVTVKKCFVKREV